MTCQVVSVIHLSFKKESLLAYNIVKAGWKEPRGAFEWRKAVGSLPMDALSMLLEWYKRGWTLKYSNTRQWLIVWAGEDPEKAYLWYSTREDSRKSGC